MSAAEALPYPPDEPDVVSGAATRCARLGAVAAQAADDLALDAAQLAGAWVGAAVDKY